MTQIKLGFISLWLMAVLLVSHSAFAQDLSSDTKPDPILEEKPYTSEEIVVTANRISGKLADVGGSSVSVITSKQIEASKLYQVEDMLLTVPGIDLVSNGGPGTSSSIFIRGADSKNTLILIDGMIFNDPSSTNRNANIGSLTLDNIERIEVVRGSQSVLYGSNATAGVVNIITKKGSGKVQSHVGLETGSYETKRLYGGSSGKVGDLEYSLFGSFAKSDGFSIANKDNEEIPQEGNTDEADGWENRTLSGKFRYYLSKDFDIGFNVRNIESRTELDDWNWSGYSTDRFNTSTFQSEPTGETNAYITSKQSFIQLEVHNFFLDRSLESTLTANQSLNDRQGFDNDDEESYDHQGQSDELAWQGNLYLGKNHVLTLGTSTMTEMWSSDSSAIDNKTATTQSLWVQDKMLYLEEDLQFIIGARQDDHENFGAATTYRVAPSFKASGTGTLYKASYGTGFRSPSLYELYSSSGNIELEAERSISYDYGIEQQLAGDSFSIGVTRFQLDFTDRIKYDGTTRKYQQLKGDTKTQGYESFITYLPGKEFQSTLNYVYTETEDPDGKPLARRPLHKYNANITAMILDKTLVSTSFRWVGERPASAFAKDKDGNSIDKHDPYSLINLALNHPLTESFDIYARIDNLTDTKYETAWSYATAGRSGMMGVKATF